MIFFQTVDQDSQFCVDLLIEKNNPAKGINIIEHMLSNARK